MRDVMIEQFKWSRRVATLAARLVLKVDTWEGIAACPSFRGTPLLTASEAITIHYAFRRG